jgi:hypothetical protein
MSYDDTLPEDKDKARFLLGDTADSELLSDDHIEAVLSMYSFNAALAFMATGLASRFARKPGSVTLPNGLSVSWAERVKNWQALALDMRNGGITASGAFSFQPTRADGYYEAAHE